jgi:hypothetical protein
LHDLVQFGRVAGQQTLLLDVPRRAISGVGEGGDVKGEQDAVNRNL